MKTARLDQILLRLGYIDDRMLTRALARQKSHGGRIGANLVQLRYITEEQLAVALAEQFALQSMTPEDDDVDIDLVKRMPPGIVINRGILPLDFDEKRNTIKLAVVDPTDEETIERVKASVGASEAVVLVAPESRVREIAGRLAEPDAASIRPKGAIDLPELFDVDPPRDEVAGPDDDTGTRSRVLMVSDGAQRKNFLPPVFLREGYELEVVADRDELEKALNDASYDRVLIAHEMIDAFNEWMADPRMPSPNAEASVFPSVSSALLGNPVPYNVVVRSLAGAIQIIADFRCREFGMSPPYGLIVKDVVALARHFGLPRLARDGLAVAAHLLLPGDPFTDFVASKNHAAKIRFPWKVVAALDGCHGLYTGESLAEDMGDVPYELRTGLQILAIVWFRHNHIAAMHGSPDEVMSAIKTSVRSQGGRLASLEIVEAYIRLLADAGDPHGWDVETQVLVVGPGDGLSPSLTAQLRRAGCRTVRAEELGDAQRIADRRAPSVIIVEYDSYPGEVEKFCRVARLAPDVLIYVLTGENEPSLTLQLLDIGVDDVFVPPHDFEVITARIHRAIRSRSRSEAKRQQKRGQFTATLNVFAFTELVQTLGLGLKSVRIDLTSGGGETAVIHMNKGQLVHAAAGDVSGVDVVYRVIAWEDGEFTVTPVSEFPPANISDSNESILMEGCRILDERKA